MSLLVLMPEQMAIQIQMYRLSAARTQWRAAKNIQDLTIEDSLCQRDYLIEIGTT